MNTRGAAYWTTTLLTALLICFGGGLGDLLRYEGTVQGMAALGYPAYFASILGAWKVLAGLALLAPRFPRLKEWAYAGIVFDLTGAAASHASVGDPAAKVITPLVLLGVVAASWALRPASRRLGVVLSDPGPDHAGAPAMSKVTA
jgi:uncharacterized membrane protein YphA (DoxX/SURF4 family)